MKRIKAHLNRRASKREPNPMAENVPPAAEEPIAPEDETPQGNAGRGVSLFCESGGPNNEEEEVLHLPVIVEAAESSPLAAREAAVRIRKFLGKENNDRPHVQYNAVMLIRILADNPGATFTRSLDGKFAATVKDLLRNSRDPSVQQILRETLETFATEKGDDEGLKPLMDMWLREKTKARPVANNAMYGQPPPQDFARHVGPLPSTEPGHQQNYFARNHKHHGLPPPAELASRIEEARTSAKLLLQVVQSTPPGEVLNNDLIAEFAQRCQSASRSIQGYINSDSPAPDDDTLLTLIETNEQLSTAMSKHQRAVLQARKTLAVRGVPYQMTPSPGAGDGPENPFGDQNRTSNPGGPPDTGFGISYNIPNKDNSSPPANGYSNRTSQLPPGQNSTTSNSLFGPPSQPGDQPAPRDESFRLTLPPQPADGSGTPGPPPSDPRWSWSQRMSTQTGYGPGGGGGGGGPGSRLGSVSQMGGQQHAPPPGPPPQQHAAPFYHRQQSAVDNQTMRGAAQGGLGVPPGQAPAPGEATVSPVSPVDTRGPAK